MAVEPIERILAVVDIVNLSLNSFKRHGNLYEGGVEEDGDAGGGKGDSGAHGPVHDDDDEEPGKDADFETNFLEEAVLKMADLLHMVRQAKEHACGDTHVATSLCALAAHLERLVASPLPCSRGTVRRARRSSSATWA